jgi:hypothetical protein
MIRKLAILAISGRSSELSSTPHSQDCDMKVSPPKCRSSRWHSEISITVIEFIPGEFGTFRMYVRINCIQLDRFQDAF